MPQTNNKQGGEKYWRDQALRWHDFGWRAEKRMAAQEELLRDALFFLYQVRTKGSISPSADTEQLIDRISSTLAEPWGVIYEE